MQSIAVRRASGVLFLAACLGSAAAGHAQDAPAPDEVTGESFTVQGVTDTVAAIMERDARLPVRALRLREKPEPGPAGPKEPNPEAPAIGQWPPAEPGDDGVPVFLRAAPPRLPQTVGTNFLGIQISDTIGFIPPDSMGAVGPTQVVVMANGRIKVFDKNGALGPVNTTADNFFASVGGTVNGTSDPHVRYDRLSQRWFIVIIDLAACPNNVLLAVSSGPTITGAASFTFFAFQGESNHFTDYPTLGVDRSALYIGGNMFPDTGPCTAALNTTAWVINKASLIAGTASITAFRTLIVANAGPWTPQGVDNDDPASTAGYFVGVDFGLFSRLVLRRVSTPGGVPTLSGNLNLTVPQTVNPIIQPQPNIAATMDSLDDRLFAAAIRRNRITGASTLWSAHNIQVSTTGVGSNTGGRNGSRWYEIDNLATTPTLRQSGTLFDSAAATPFGYWIPSVTASGQGHMAIAASRASTSAANGGFASAAAAGRLRGDALGTTQAPTALLASTFTYFTGVTNPERWGDYSQTVVDPNDDQTMWTFQEYANVTNSWGVRVTRLIAPPPATPASTTPPSVAAGLASVNVTVTGTSAAGSEFFDPGADAGGPGFLNRIAAAVGPSVTVNSVTFDSTTQVTLNLSTVGSTVGVKDVTVTNPDGQARTGIGIFAVTGCGTVTVSPTAVPAGAVGSLYAQTFTQTGGTAPVVFGFVGSLPTGVTFNAATATISGTPTQVGSFNFTISVNDTNNCSGSRAYTLVIGCQAIAVNPVTIPAGTVAAAYSQTFTQTSGIGTITWSVTGTLPTGVTLNAGTGVLSGTPTQTGSFPITVTASDANGCTGTRAVTLVIGCQSIAVNPATVPAGTAGTAYSQAFTQTSGIGTVTWSVTGVLPTGVTLNTGTGVLSGTPTQTGSFPITVTATDANGCTGTRAVTLAIGCQTITVNPATIPAGTAGTAYSQAFTQTSGIGTITWSVAGALPTGITLNAGTGVLSGTPTQTGSFPISVTATDVNGCTGTRAATLVIVRAGPFTAAALAVDTPGNAVFEPGETVVVAPSWRNGTGAPEAVTGAMTAFTGPAGATYTIGDPAGSYGLVAPAAVVSCTITGNCFAVAVNAPATRPTLHWDSTVLETLSSTDTKAWTLHIGQTFTDVPSASGFYRFVETIVHKNVTGGCTAATYCPSSSTTRDQMAVFVLVSKEPAGFLPPACGATPMFADVPPSSPFCRWVEELARRGVVGGCATGLYCPTSPATREQMAVFVLRTLDPALNPPACGTPMFNDVPATSPFCKWIEELARRNVVTGCGGGNYCPTAAVTREQMSVFLTVTFGLVLYGL